MKAMFRHILFAMLLMSLCNVNQLVGMEPEIDAGKPRARMRLSETYGSENREILINPLSEAYSDEAREIVINLKKTSLWDVRGKIRQKCSGSEINRDLTYFRLKILLISALGSLPPVEEQSFDLTKMTIKDNGQDLKIDSNENIDRLIDILIELTRTHVDKIKTDFPDTEDPATSLSLSNYEPILTNIFQEIFASLQRLLGKNEQHINSNIQKVFGMRWQALQDTITTRIRNNAQEIFKTRTEFTTLGFLGKIFEAIDRYLEILGREQATNTIPVITYGDLKKKIEDYLHQLKNKYVDDEGNVSKEEIKKTKEVWEREEGTGTHNRVTKIVLFHRITSEDITLLTVFSTELMYFIGLVFNGQYPKSTDIINIKKMVDEFADLQGQSGSSLHEENEKSEMKLFFTNALFSFNKLPLLIGEPTKQQKKEAIKEEIYELQNNINRLIFFGIFYNSRSFFTSKDFKEISLKFTKDVLTEIFTKITKFIIPPTKTTLKEDLNEKGEDSKLINELFTGIDDTTPLTREILLEKIKVARKEDNFRFTRIPSFLEDAIRQIAASRIRNQRCMQAFGLPLQEAFEIFKTKLEAILFDDKGKLKFNAKRPVTTKTIEEIFAIPRAMHKHKGSAKKPDLTMHKHKKPDLTQALQTALTTLKSKLVELQSTLKKLAVRKA